LHENVEHFGRIERARVGNVFGVRGVGGCFRLFGPHARGLSLGVARPQRRRVPCFERRLFIIGLGLPVARSLFHGTARLAKKPYDVVKLYALGNPPGQYPRAPRFFLGDLRFFLGDLFNFRNAELCMHQESKV
jgi:hypothetical protein